MFRIAGDKFVLLASSEAYETVLDQAERVFRRNGEKVHYQGNAVELAMFGGLIRLDQGDARSERLFEKLDGVLGRRWELTKRNEAIGAKYRTTSASSRLNLMGGKRGLAQSLFQVGGNFGDI